MYETRNPNLAAQLVGGNFLREPLDEAFINRGVLAGSGWADCQQEEVGVFLAGVDEGLNERVKTLAVDQAADEEQNSAPGRS